MLRSRVEFIILWDKITIFTKQNSISLEIPSLGKIYLYYLCYFKNDPITKIYIKYYITYFKVSNAKV